MEQIEQKFATKQSWTLGQRNNKLINFNNNKEDEIDEAGRNRSNLMKFERNNAKKTFYTQATVLMNRARIISRKALILKQCEAISAKTPTNKSKCVFFHQITKPNKKNTIFTQKSLEHPVKQVQGKRPQISTPKIFEPT